MNLRRGSGTSTLNFRPPHLSLNRPRLVEEMRRGERVNARLAPKSVDCGNRAARIRELCRWSMRLLRTHKTERFFGATADQLTCLCRPHRTRFGLPGTPDLDVTPSVQNRRERMTSVCATSAS